MEKVLDVVVGRRVRFTGDICNQPGQGVVVSLPEEGCVSGTLILFDGRKMDFNVKRVARGDSYRYTLLDKIHGSAMIEMAKRKHAEVEAARVIEAEREKVLYEEARKQLIAENPHLEVAGDYYRAAFVSRNIRRHLKRLGIKTLRVRVRAGGDSIRVLVVPEDYEAAKSACGLFQAGSFNSIVDYYESNRSPWCSAFGGVSYVFVDAAATD